MSSLQDRMIRAAKLDVSLYEEVEADTGATSQALKVVLLSSVAAGIGSLFYVGFSGLVFSVLAAVIGWFLWALTTYFVGTRLLPEPQTKADLGELLRTTGFAQAPGIIRVAGIVPFFGMLVNLVAFVWMLVAMVIAVRQALDYSSTGRAVAVCVIGAIAYIMVTTLVLAVPAMLGLVALGS